eukprot:365679-Chlamydomonas_euryale.AAC.37
MLLWTLHTAKRSSRQTHFALQALHSVPCQPHAGHGRVAAVARVTRHSHTNAAPIPQARD